MSKIDKSNNSLELDNKENDKESTIFIMSSMS